MVVKVREKFEKTRNIKKYMLQGERNAIYHDTILSNKKKSYNLT